MAKETSKERAERNKRLREALERLRQYHPSYELPKKPKRGK